ncbi:MAG: agmatine deiminase family protein [Muribaculum sp.]|nr:agmatine deiminase family protein [Muribaculum sp.]
MTTTNDFCVRFPAEWEPNGAVLLSWPHADSDWAPMLDEVTSCFVEIASAIADEAIAVIVAPDTSIPRQLLSDHPHQERLLYFDCPTNDTWARDFGPLTMQLAGKPVLYDFKFNGWGLKFAADKDNLITSAMVKSGLLRAPYANKLGFVLEGGSIESDGRGTLLTTSTCLLSPNRNGEMSMAEIETYLKAAFGLKQILWLNHGALAGDDTDSHIDTLARLAPGDTILYTSTDDPEDVHYRGLKKMEEELKSMRTLSGMPYNLVALPLPDAIFDGDDRLPATYANFLIMERSILMPSYGQPRNDRLASQIVKIAFPDHEVRMVDCRPLIKQHGSLHCVTMQLPKEILSI